MHIVMYPLCTIEERHQKHLLSLGVENLYKPAVYHLHIQVQVIRANREML